MGITSRSFLFVTWDGGGNLPPALGIAQQLVAMGHRARFLGHRAQRADVEAAGFGFRVFERSPDYDADVPVAEEDIVPFLFDHIVFEPAMAADVEAEMDREWTDGVVVDCMLTAPMSALEARGSPWAVLVHTLYRFFDGWDLAGLPGSPRLATLRRSRGLAPLATLQDTWLAAGTVLVVSPLELDPPTAPLPPNTMHVGLVADRSRDGADVDADWRPEAAEPLVLVSFSTTAMAQEQMLNRVAEALSTLPVKVLMTTGHGVDRGALHPAANTTLRDFVPHGSVLPHASLAICHAGHGTVMAALSHGVPLLCLPMGRDQPMVAGRVDAIGAGLVLDESADVAAIREAVTTLLGDPGFRCNAQVMAAIIGRRDGPRVAADELLQIVGAAVP